MISGAVLLYLLAAICFLIAALGFPVPRVNLIALGLFFWVLTYLLPAIRG